MRTLTNVLNVISDQEIFANDLKFRIAAYKPIKYLVIFP